MPMQLSEFNLNDLVPEVMTELDPVITRSKLTVTPTLCADLPLVFSDRQKVKQILVNFLSNALKFTHEGGIAIMVGYEPRDRTATARCSSGPRRIKRPIARSSEISLAPR